MVVFIQITSGTAIGPYSIYYDSISPSNLAKKVPLYVPAINLTLSELNAGIDVFIPNGTSVIILYNETCGTSQTFLFPTATPTNTTTPTPTPTVTPTSGIVIQFQDCEDGNNLFRFGGNGMPFLNVGDVYYISNSSNFLGCATVITNTGAGTFYNSDGVTFTYVESCANSLCPQTSISNAQLSKCSDGTLHYFLVNKDTAFVGATYFYNGECYSFIEFSGQGGPYLGDPAFSSCSFCVPTQTPTRTPRQTPTITPTPSTTPTSCNYNEFCLRTKLPSLSAYSGTYSSTTLTHNSRLYYTGNGITLGYVYHTGINWCLSNSLGGICLLNGAIPCYESCPDLSINIFTVGPCLPLPPGPPNCDILDFTAYFDCDYTPPPTPVPPIDCGDVGFDYTIFPLTPTPTPSLVCNGGIDFTLSSYTPSHLITPTPSPTPTTKNNQVGGTVTYEILDKMFNCTSVKVLLTNDGQELYTSDSLRLNGVPLVIGTTFLAKVNGNSICLTYIRDDENISSNISIDEILQLTCDSPEPTQTQTTTNTPTNTPTNESTPTNTPTNTSTPTNTRTSGLTPEPTTTSTKTPTTTPTSTIKTTPTQTSTPTPSSNFVYVYESCQPVAAGATQKTRVIQPLPVSTNTGIFKNGQICWRYIGRFNTGYISPSGFITINNSGNYFGLTSDFGSCSTCLAPPPPPPGCCTLNLTITLQPSVQVDTEIFFSWTNCLGKTRDGSTGQLSNNRGFNTYRTTINNYREGTFTIPISQRDIIDVQVVSINCVSDSAELAPGGG